MKNLNKFYKSIKRTNLHYYKIFIGCINIQKEFNEHFKNKYVMQSIRYRKDHNKLYPYIKIFDINGFIIMTIKFSKSEFCDILKRFNIDNRVTDITKYVDSIFWKKRLIREILKELKETEFYLENKNIIDKEKIICN